jgi:hypothetical protein
MKLKANWKQDTWRPTKKTTEVLKKLQEAYEVNCTDEEAASHAGISEATLNNRKKEDEKFLELIHQWRRSYTFHIREASFKRAKNTKNRDSTEILFKIDNRYSDKQDIDVKADVSLVGIAKRMQQKRLDREKGKPVADE